VSALERALGRVAPHMLIGGVAVIAHGVRRLTDDVDATLWGEGVVLEALVRRLATQKIVPRIADALVFAQKNQVLLLRHEPSGVDIDLSLAWLPFERDALARSESKTIGERRVRVATPGDLVVYKAIAARQRDLSDIERLLELHASSIDLPRVRRTVEELASILERPELVEGLDKIVRAVRGAARPTKVRRKRLKRHPRRKSR
jgi:hypothetical protein